MDLYLDPATHDLVLDDDTGLPTSIDGGIGEVAQRIRITMETQRGEWFLNSAFGVRWREVAFQKSPNTRRLDAELRRVVGSVEGVSRVISVSSSLNKATRALSIAMRVATPESVLDVTSAPIEISRPQLVLFFSEVEAGLAP